MLPRLSPRISTATVDSGAPVGRPPSAPPRPAPAKKVAPRAAADYPPPEILGDARRRARIPPPADPLAAPGQQPLRRHPKAPAVLLGLLRAEVAPARRF